MNLRKYSYLEKCVKNAFSYLEYEGPSDPKDNSFYKVRTEFIENFKQMTGLSLPSQLLEFYKEIGWGRLVKNINGEVQESYSNLLLPPDFIQSILIDEESEFVDPYTEFEKDELPFFEIADAASFLVMKPFSDNPNAVYDQCGDKIEDNFEDFIYNLYHKSPTYYLYLNESYEDVVRRHELEQKYWDSIGYPEKSKDSQDHPNR